MNTEDNRISVFIPLKMSKQKPKKELNVLWFMRFEDGVIYLRTKRLYKMRYEHRVHWLYQVISSRVYSIPIYFDRFVHMYCT